jgi:enoyl-CoA hydratase/carnithine racemase
VRVHRDGDRLEVTLCRPARRNAFDAAMRDALAEALLAALDMGPTTEVVLCGEGPSFSAGGDLDEFGAARDLALAHAIRMQRSPAALARRLGSRLTVVVHGACIGAGIEIPAAAARVVARGETFFRLPEVGMGLIPGAGGTASILRRIGRHRAFFMALCGCDIDARTALEWGLIDELA